MEPELYEWVAAVQANLQMATDLMADWSVNAPERYESALEYTMRAAGVLKHMLAQIDTDAEDAA